jgi:hypothetical protein
MHSLCDRGDLTLGPENSAKVSVVTGTNRTKQERVEPLTFHRLDVNLTEFKTLVHEARDVIELNLDSWAFSTDILRVKLSGPTQPHLTLVNLPGLFRADNKCSRITMPRRSRRLSCYTCKKREALFS